MAKALATRLALLTALALTSACKIHETDVPNLVGPSEFALSLNVFATPDTIRLDGVAQSSIVVTAHDASGQPQPGVSLRLGLSVDYGTLSTTSVVTGGDGRATAVYTAPPAPVTFAVPPQIITVFASTINSNYQTVQARSADVLLIPVSLIMPAPDSPVAFFTFTPASPAAGDLVAFDGSASVARSGSTIVQYIWNWGDGDAPVTRNVPFEQHDFVLPGTYVVTLTVVDNAGRTGTIARSVTVVGKPAEPTT